VVNRYFDIPPALKRKCKNGSEALRCFYRHFFVDTYGLTRREVDLSFLKQLTPDELQIARDLLRRNLGRSYTHIIEGAAALGDIEAVPLLRSLLAQHSDLSRRLTIAGSLWKLARDPCFPNCIAEMVASGSTTLKETHVEQILWLGDERSIHHLIKLLNDGGSFVRFLALSHLNGIEHGERFLFKALPTSAEEYKNRQNDDYFIDHMVNRLQKWNQQTSA
jgi:hypothetical protein